MGQKGYIFKKNKRVSEKKWAFGHKQKRWDRKVTYLKKERFKMKVKDYNLFDIFMTYHDYDEEEISNWWVVSGILVVVFVDGTRMTYDLATQGYRNLKSVDDYWNMDEDEWMIEFAKHLSWLMNMKYIDQTTLARKSGLSRKSINRYTTGKSIPSAYNLERIAAAMKCDVTELLFYSDVK